MPAWSRLAPLPVIAGLGDDLDRATRGDAHIGLVGEDAADRGLIGGTWYGDVADDDVRIVNERDHLRHVRHMLESGYGRDAVPDLLAVAASGAPAELDADLGKIVTAARRAARGSVLVVVAGTGAVPGAPDATQEEVATLVSSSVGAVVERAAGGGLFLDQRAGAAANVSDADLAEALLRLRARNRPLFTGAFPALTISFARYC